MLEDCIRRVEERQSVDSALTLAFKKRRLITELPLKKRYHQSKESSIEINCKNAEKVEQIDENNIHVNNNDSPVDFTLPNRIRASVANSFVFTTDAEQNDEINLKSVMNKKASPVRSSFTSSIQLPLELSLRMLFPSMIWPVNIEEKMLHLAQTTPRRKSGQNSVKSEPLSRLEDSKPLPVECFVKSKNSKSSKLKKGFKNVPHDRRIEANARERTRVHTISAAFEQVRQLIPCLSSDQKLSKLSVLRLACNYILLLASMNDLDYSADGRKYSVEECVELFTETLNTEAKYKKF